MVKQSEIPDLSRSEVEYHDPSGMAQAYLTEPEPKAPGLVPGVTLVPGGRHRTKQTPHLGAQRESRPIGAAKPTQNRGRKKTFSHQFIVNKPPTEPKHMPLYPCAYEALAQNKPNGIKPKTNATSSPIKNYKQKPTLPNSKKQTQSNPMCYGGAHIRIHRACPRPERQNDRVRAFGGA
jgi:hypothetical protein